MHVWDYNQKYVYVKPILTYTAVSVSIKKKERSEVTYTEN